MDRIKPIWSKCMLFLAMSILLLHSFIPHSHHEEKDMNSTVLSCDKTERCLLDILGVILEHDFEEDHLEHFQLSEINYHDFNVDLVPHHVIVVEKSAHFTLKPDGCHYEELFILPPDLNVYCDRGPPRYS
jgi:hypothetical protein